MEGRHTSSSSRAAAGGAAIQIHITNGRAAILDCFGGFAASQ
jgi:hypothetical protein